MAEQSEELSENQVNQVDIEIKPVEPDQVKQALTNFAEKMRNEGKTQIYTLLNQPFQWNEPQFILTLTHPVHEDIINEIRQDLLQFIRDEVSNPTIQLSIELKDDTPQQRKLYTNSEKFEYLSQKYPLLKELQERLGLDPDF